MADALSGGASGAKRGRRGPPPPSRQKSYIVENAGILDPDTKKTILRIVMMEVGKFGGARASQTPRPVVLENGTTGEISIHLDHIDNAEVVLHIYNIVSNRRAALNEPAHAGKH
jgi:hypothetical protein